MKRVCYYCGGKRKWESGLSVVSGEVWYTTCHICEGTGWLEEEAPPVDTPTEEDKEKLRDKLARENIEMEQRRKIIREAIRQGPGFFK